MSHLKFTGNQSHFYVELKKRVNAYFEERKISTTGDYRNVVKSIILLSVFLSSYIILAFHLLPGIWSLLICVLLGFVTALIGFNIMHDGAHGSLSKKPAVNKLAALTLNMLGASSFLWNIKHNVIHHTFTNVESHDDDILNEPFFRMAENQKLRFGHRFQHLYWPLAYGLIYIAWVFFLDIKKYFNRQVAEKKEIQWKLSNHIGFWLTKICYIGMYIVLPLQYFSFSSWILGFLVYTVTTGLTISTVFQMAHTIEETDFIAVDDSNMLPTDWATHQVKTTANFATRNKIITWLVGGLNHQVEHHLFPKISHIHYPALSYIVKDVCKKYGLPYHEQPTFRSAIKSHVRFLYKLGRN